MHSESSSVRHAVRSTDCKKLGDAPLIMAAVASLLLFSLLIDLVPRFFLMDSVVFIYTHAGGFIPDNRSWTYGLAIGWLIRATGQLIAVPLTQILLQWAAFTAFAIAAAASLGIGWINVAWIVVIGCLEPLGLYWSRSLMADSPAQSAFLLLCAALQFCSGNLLGAVPVFAVGFALISLRVVYFPAVFAALLATTVWQFGAGRNPDFPAASNSRVRNLAAALAALLLANFAYAYANTSMTRGHTLSTNIGDMEFLVGTLSPLMGGELNVTPLTPQERATLPPLTYENRVSNLWDPKGLVPTIRRHFSTTEAARPLMRSLVLGAILHHPTGLAELVFRQWLDYLDVPLVLSAQRQGWLSGAAPLSNPVILPAPVIHIFQEWKIRPPPSPDAPTRPSPALWYLDWVGGVWSLVLSYYATFSVLILFLVPKNRRTTLLVFSNSFALLYMGTIAFGGVTWATRFLLPLNAPLLYTAAVLIRARAGQTGGCVAGGSIKKERIGAAG